MEQFHGKIAPLDVIYFIEIQEVEGNSTNMPK